MQGSTAAILVGGIPRPLTAGVHGTIWPAPHRGHRQLIQTDPVSVLVAGEDQEIVKQ